MTIVEWATTLGGFATAVGLVGIGMVLYQVRKARELQIRSDFEVAYGSYVDQRFQWLSLLATNIGSSESTIRLRSSIESMTHKIELMNVYVADLDPERAQQVKTSISADLIEILGIAEIWGGAPKEYIPDEDADDTGKVDADKFMQSVQEKMTRITDPEDPEIHRVQAEFKERIETLDAKLEAHAQVERKARKIADGVQRALEDAAASMLALERKLSRRTARRRQ